MEKNEKVWHKQTGNTGYYGCGSTFNGVSYTYTGEGTLGKLTDHANSRVYNYSYDNLYRLTGLSETFTDSNNATHSVQNYSVSYDDASRVSGYSYDKATAC